MARLKFLLALVLSVVLFGCAGNLGLVKGQASIDTSSKSLVLIPVTVSNQNRPGYQPDLLYAYFTGTEKQHVSTKDALFKEEKDKYKEYLLSFSLQPGSYTLEQILGNYKIPLILNAFCNVPLKAKFEVKPNSVSYLGHVSATIVERKGDEERAGSVIPLLDQGVSGFSNGTFVINISDRYDEDLANYRSEFPGLKGTTIEKAILPQWQPPTVATTASR